MNDIVTGLLWGIGGSLVVIPFVIWFYHVMKNTFERRKIKKLINKKEFLTPIDEKDYDVKAWEKDIDTTNNKQKRQDLSKMFDKDKDNIEEVKVEEIKPIEGNKNEKTE